MTIIRFTKHAREKFTVLDRHGFKVTEQQVIDTVRAPDRIEPGLRWVIAQKRISESHVLRVVYSRQDDEIIIITFYPGRRSRYESQL